MAADDVASVIAEQVVAAVPTPVQLVAGPADLTGDEVAAALGGWVRWRTVTPQAYGDLVRPYLGATTAAGIAASYEAPPPEPDPSIIRRGTTTLRQWAARQSWTG